MGTMITMVAASVTGNESGLAAIDVPMNGHILGVEWAGYTSFDTTLDHQAWQLSFSSTLQTVNDSRAIISMVSLGTITVGAAGVMVGVADKVTAPMRIPVAAGERLYIHSVATAGVVGTIFCIVQFDFDVMRAAGRRS